ncbi:MAG TPA: ribonuclease III [Nitrolancea sp.]|nr:ribonuclease III [Nitrolancea sp.]
MTGNASNSQQHTTLPTIWPDDQRAQRARDLLGVPIEDLGLLRLALTHRSYLNEQGIEPPQAMHYSNERLEFLGDSILGMITAEALYQRYPDLPEGSLTAYRTALVRTETLATWARQFELDALLYLGRGESADDGDIRDRILAGAFEAVIAAIYLDRGLSATRSFLTMLLDEDAEEIITLGQETNYKGRLQELIQERKRVTPSYNTVSVEGPAHERIFTVEVVSDGQSLGIGTGSSKRTAQQMAAQRALITLAAEGNDDERSV